MHFTPKEQDKLTLLMVGLIAERRLKKGLKLNYPEAVAYITSAALEGAREGKTVEEVMHDASNVLTKDQVMGGSGGYDNPTPSRGRIHRRLASGQHSSTNQVKTHQIQ